MVLHSRGASVVDVMYAISSRMHVRFYPNWELFTEWMHDIKTSAIGFLNDDVSSPDNMNC